MLTRNGKYVFLSFETDLYSMKRFALVLIAFTLLASVAQARKVTGTVSCGTVYLSGVVVTDGENFTTTNKKGKFSFEIKDDAEHVFIVTPAGYVADWSSGVPAFYQKAEGVSKFNFNLHKTVGGQDYNIIAMADPHMDTPEHFAKFLPEYANLDEMKDHYRRGGLGDGTCKKFLFNIMEDFLQPMREKRAHYEQNIPQVYEILRKGSEQARAAAAETLADVRKAMKINYFEDAELIAEHTKKYQK